ncbi:MAG: hypothetical protein K0S58_2503 [Nitrospira sp.]|jgi:hypothetical protein|nr:hypothetical protein [Nitrospira sp.]
MAWLECEDMAAPRSHGEEASARLDRERAALGAELLVDARPQVEQTGSVFDPV